MNADDILSISDLRTKTIYVEKWGRDVIIQELGLLPMMQMYQTINVKDVESGKVEVNAMDIARIVSMGVVDDSGCQVFTDEHIPALAKKNRDALLFVYTEIMALSGSQDDAEKN